MSVFPSEQLGDVIAEAFAFAYGVDDTDDGDDTAYTFWGSGAARAADEIAGLLDTPAAEFVEDDVLYAPICQAFNVVYSDGDGETLFESGAAAAVATVRSMQTAVARTEGAGLMTE